uniref:Uncharacterized protein n=1 Tax=North Fork virus TaxID=3139876 RepID=A0AAN0LKB2_9VIRU
MSKEGAMPPPPPMPGSSPASREKVAAAKLLLERQIQNLPPFAPSAAGLGDDDDRLRQELSEQKEKAGGVFGPQTKAPPPPIPPRQSPSDNSDSSLEAQASGAYGKAGLLALAGSHPSVRTHYAAIEEKSPDYWRGAISMYHVLMESHAAEKGRRLEEFLEGLMGGLENLSGGMDRLCVMISRNEDVMKTSSDSISKSASALAGSVALTTSPALSRDAVPPPTAPSALPAPFSARQKQGVPGVPLAGTLRARIQTPAARSTVQLLNKAPQGAINSFTPWAPQDIVDTVARLNPSLDDKGALALYSELSTKVPQKPGQWTLT